MMLPHLANRLYHTPLLIQSAKLDAILPVLGERIGWPTAPAPARRQRRYPPAPG